MTRHPLNAGLLVLVAGCASPPPPAAAPATTAEPPPPASASAAASTAAAPEEPARHFRPIELTNACAHDVHVYFGDRPGDGHGTSATVATASSVPVPRGPDGTVVVWVVDDQGQGLASVHVTRWMRHVRFDPGCMKLEADSAR